MTLASETVKGIVNGTPIALTRSRVIDAMRGVPPESIRSHFVDVAGVSYPVKQVFAAATGLDRLDFTSAVARRHLLKLGFDVERAAG
jgi:hypothetical protein